MPLLFQRSHLWTGDSGAAVPFRESHQLGQCAQKGIYHSLCAGFRLTEPVFLGKTNPAVHGRYRFYLH